MKQVFGVDLFDGHMILVINGQKILVDTGSPVTISRNSQFEFMGQNYECVNSFANKDISAISDLMGYSIDVLMGMNILNNYIIIIDYNQNKVLFSDEPINYEPLCSTHIIRQAMGIVCIEMKVTDRNLKFALDTGAKISYIENTMLIGESEVETREDFTPFMGHFQTPIYAMKATIDNQSFPVDFGRLPTLFEKSLQIIGISGVIGYDLFSAFTTILDFKKDILAIIKPNKR